jgi:hypothetical protein
MSAHITSALDTFEQRFTDLKESVPFGKELDEGYLVEYVRRNLNRTLVISFGANKWNAAAPGESESILLTAIDAAVNSLAETQERVDRVFDLARERRQTMEIVPNNPAKDEWRITVGTYQMVKRVVGLTPGYARLKMITDLAQATDWLEDNSNKKVKN